MKGKLNDNSRGPRKHPKCPKCGWYLDFLISTIITGPRRGTRSWEARCNNRHCKVEISELTAQALGDKKWGNFQRSRKIQQKKERNDI